LSTAYLARSKLFDPKEFRALLDTDSEGPVSVFRTTLEAGAQVLEEFFLKGASAQDVVQSRAWLVDHIVVEAWRLHLSEKTRDHSALVAVGGYGRGELHPCSDIDLMLLLSKSPNDETAEELEQFTRFLWDIGLEIGHSVRTVKDCVVQAKADVTVMTNIMESRLLDGSDELLDKMITQTSTKKIWPARKFFDAKLQEQSERHLKFDETGYNLEPNLKEGPGGLRDIQVIGWVTGRYFGNRSLRELVEHDFLTEEEHRTLIRGRNFIWRLRIGLHLVAGRAEDRLLFDHQRQLAQMFGYEDRPGSLAVEQLMKRYFRTVKEVSLLNEILLQHIGEAVFSTRKPKKVRINRRFEALDGYLDTTSSTVFTRFPFALLEVFHILQQNSDLKGIRARTIRQIRENLIEIDQSYRQDLRCRSLFMAIMREPAGQTHALRRMNAYGVLGAYLPAFGHSVGQMQHDLFHVYTVDAHSLFVLRNVRRFTLDKHAEDHPLANEIMARTFKRERLYLAALFHDIAKGRGGDHSDLGAVDAYNFCKANDMSEYDAELVSWLVKRHLNMSYTAQREDISDPEVVQRFASIVGDQEHLDHLYMLTIADVRGTNPAVWNSWKARLLEDLYLLTSRALRLGLRETEDIQTRVDVRKSDALTALDAKRVKNDAAENLWQLLKPEYFTRHDADTIAWHTEQIATAGAADLPVVSARYNEETDVTQCLIYAPDSEELLSRVTAGFDRTNIDVVHARCHRALAGFALYAFVVLSPTGKPIRGENDLARLEKRVRDQLLTVEAERHDPKPATSRTVKAFPIKTVVNFPDTEGATDTEGETANQPSTSSDATVMEVIAQDRPGLLHQVSLALLDCKVVLQFARISTFGERAEDVFFVTDRDGQPVTDPAQRECLSTRIHDALSDSTDSPAKSNAA